LLLSINGMSKLDSSYIDGLPPREKQIERFCNGIAAEVLMPLEDFLEKSVHFPPDVEEATDEQFSALAARYGVSREAVLRRFLDQGRASQAFYLQKARTWAAQKKASSGGNWYLNQGAYLSDRFANEVVRRRYQERLTVEQAAE